ncbi:MAG TPA: LysR substrate-binding domain-containing protein [Aliidongia sp.]|uniref:LysR family transcriptional regulator n=1 Tax=Aliidongia sp. TaxID=1914230 RepID=UPI002DDD334D|nr:LysR substrate-binding domain-containing protein [Aliidongia sp.]HEV2676135.1 LysR substrate-binding domain-containing protein [Aliidongia sp.]
MDLLALADFNLVASHGGFGRASRASGRPKATLSRRVMELEESLGVRLLERGARSLRLTEEGSTLYARTEGLLSEIAEVGATIGAGLARPRGRLRVSAPVLLAHAALGRIAADFIVAYPEVRLEITADDRFVDPVEEGYDLVIRVNPRPDHELVGRCFIRDQLVVAAPASLARPPSDDPDIGVPVPAVLLATAPEGTIWRLQDGERSRILLPDPILRVSSFMMVRDAIRAGAGAAQLPRFLIRDDLAAGRLVSWGVSDRSVEIWALHTSRRLESPKVSAFMQFLCDAFPDASL